LIISKQEEIRMLHSDGFLKLVNDAKSRVHEVGVDEVRERQERKEDFIFVDVREDSEWIEGHAAGAIHLGKGIIERDIEQVIPDKNADIVLYCGGGYRSALAADALRLMGYTNIHSMDGGIKAWRGRGFPMTKD
jgi:rhodanese-related sulfurtransferase